MYQKANPRADIDARARDQFWSKQEVRLDQSLTTDDSQTLCVCCDVQKEEGQRRVQDRKTAAEERKELELQRRQREVITHFT